MLIKKKTCRAEMRGNDQNGCCVILQRPLMLMELRFFNKVISKGIMAIFYYSLFNFNSTFKIIVMFYEHICSFQQAQKSIDVFNKSDGQAWQDKLRNVRHMAKAMLQRKISKDFPYKTNCCICL